MIDRGGFVGDAPFLTASFRFFGSTPYSSSPDPFFILVNQTTVLNPSSPPVLVEHLWLISIWVHRDCPPDPHSPQWPLPSLNPIFPSRIIWILQVDWPLTLQHFPPGATTEYPLICNPPSTFFPHPLILWDHFFIPTPPRIGG